MMPRSHLATASGSVTIVREYSVRDSSYEGFSTVLVGQTGETAGDVEPLLDQPIDFEAELAERGETHRPVDMDPGADTSNTAFGI